jgi:putative membrane protein
MKLIPYLTAAGVIGALTLATPTVAQAASPTQVMPAHASFAPAQTGSSSNTVTAISRQDRMFLKKAHQGNLTEIKAGQLALRKGQCEAVKRIARMFTVDHSRMDIEVRALADRFDVRLPNAPSAAQQRQIAKLATLSGREFDTAWLRQQSVWHHEAIELGRQQLSHGRSPEVKALAKKAAPVIRHHLRLIDQAKEHC